MKALVFGGSGLTGSSLLTQLAADKRFTSIISVGRRTLDGPEDRVKQLVVSLDSLDQSADMFVCDVVFVCLGTTIAKAGSKAAFEKVDFRYVSDIARLAAQKSVKKIIVVSSIGADAKSNNFYLRTKGKMEAYVSNAGLEVAIFVRPSLLLGERKEFRFGEKIGTAFMKAFEWMLFGKWKNYRSISAGNVASAMIYAALNMDESAVIESHQLKLLAKKYSNI